MEAHSDDLLFGNGGGGSELDPRANAKSFHRLNLSGLRRNIANLGLAMVALKGRSRSDSGRLGGGNAPVPSACIPAVNQNLAKLVASSPSVPVDNVMVCGTTVSSSRTQSGGSHGDHQILPLRVSMPDGDVRLVD